MTVYVDDMRARYGRMIMCHMISDSEEELHAMADRIGVARRWYQGDHYDVSLGMRERAIAGGAVPITLRQCAIMAMNRRRGLPLGTPEEAQARLDARFAPRETTL